MKISSKSMEKVTTFIEDEPVRITNCYMLGPVDNPVENDYFNTNISNIFIDDLTPITEGEYRKLKNGNEIQCVFHSKTIRESPALVFPELMNDNERIFVLNNLYCSKKRRVIIRVGKTCKTKVWINNYLVANCIIFSIDSYFITFELEKGDNILFIELSSLEKGTPIAYSLRVNDYANELAGIDGELIHDYLSHNIFDKITVLQEKWDFSEDSSYEFMLIPRDFINVRLDEKIHISVVAENGSIIEEFETECYQKVKYYIEKTKANNVLLTFSMNYKTSSGKEECLENIVLAKNLEGLLSEIKRDYQQVKYDFHLTNEDIVNIEGRIKDIMNGEPGIKKKEKENITRIIRYIKNGFHFTDFIKENGPNSVYFHSVLDDQIEKYHLSIPTKYSCTKKYPLIIFIPAGRYEYFSAFFGKLDNWQIIITDVTGRGVTTGSYIGEASIMEIFQDIIGKYNVDMDRIYLIGHSNGAYATWALAQAYPYLFSAIVPISGVPNKENLKNLMNVNILSICGDKDHLLEEGTRIPSVTLAEHNKFTAITLKESDHNSIYFSGFSKYIMEWLIQHKRERYPKKIYFRTERIRHNKTYWAEICSIDNTAQYAEVEGEIVDDSTIVIKIMGVSKFILTIPDYMNRDHLVVKINDKVFSFNNKCVENRLYFAKDETSYILHKNRNEMEPQYSSKGMGVLDIYMDSLKIVIPEGNNSEECAVISEIAYNFAKPATQGWDHRIYVDYPILREDLLKRDDLERNNLIIIDCQNNNKMVEKIKDKLPIKFDAQGYEYNNIYTQTDYCLIMIFASPFCEGKKVLLIYANNYKILKRCLFTRKLIFPSYANGLHIFLNNEVIIYNGTNYFGTHVLGNDISLLI